MGRTDLYRDYVMTGFRICNAIKCNNIEEVSLAQAANYRSAYSLPIRRLLINFGSKSLEQMRVLDVSN